MAVPDLDKFQQWLELARQPPPLPAAFEWLSHEEIPKEIEISPGIALECRLAIDAAVRTAYDELAKQPVHSWLTSQREFDRAYHLVFYGRRRVQRNETALRNTEGELREAVAKMFADAEKRSQEQVWHEGRVTQKVAEELQRIYRWRLPSDSWLADCIEALREYHYDDTWERCIELSRSPLGTTGKAVSALNDVLIQWNAIDALNLTHGRNATYQTIRGKRTINQCLAFLESALQGDSSDGYFPVKRHDSTARERFFVFRLCRSNKRRTGRPRAQAIQELMGLEGIQHQFDLRRIERLCKEFTGKKTIRA